MQWKEVLGTKIGITLVLGLITIIGGIKNEK